MENASTVMRQHQKHVEDLETNCRQREEINGDELRKRGCLGKFARFEKVACGTAPCTWSHCSRRCRGRVSATRRECGVRPKQDSPRHPADQVASLAGNRGASGLSPSNLPSPKQAKAHAMPGHNRFRLDDDECRAPIAPYTRQRSPEEAVHCGYFWTSLQRASKHADLMAQSQVFHLEVNTRPDETQEDKKSDQRSRHRMQKKNKHSKV